RIGWRPTGKTVVTDVKASPRPEVASREFGDDAMVVAAHPGPDAMHADAVELRQIITGEQLLEAVVVDPEIATAVARHTAGVRGMGRVEVGGDEPARIGSRVDIDRTALPTPQFAVRRSGV